MCLTVRPLGLPRRKMANSRLLRPTMLVTIAWLSPPPGYHHQLAITTANAFLSAFRFSSPKARHGLVTRGVCGHRLTTDDHHVHPPSSSLTVVLSHHHSARGRSIVSPLVSVFTAILMLGHAIAIFTGDHLHWHGQPCRQATIPSLQSPSLLVFCIKGRRARADELQPKDSVCGPDMLTPISPASSGDGLTGLLNEYRPRPTSSFLHNLLVHCRQSTQPSTEWCRQQPPKQEWTLAQPPKQEWTLAQLLHQAFVALIGLRRECIPLRS